MGVFTKGGSRIVLGEHRERGASLEWSSDEIGERVDDNNATCRTASEPWLE